MFHNNLKPYTKTLENGLVLKSISTPAEIERLAAFNVAVHEDDVLDMMTRSLIENHPSTHPQEWLFVEDPATSQIVSSLCLLPWEWEYGSVTLKAGEMGIVGTAENYRHQGLIRALNNRFVELLNEGKYDLSHIQGIPYYYRLFGYEYTLPLEGGWQLPLHKIPANLPDYAQGYTFHLAQSTDIPLLAKFYEEAMRKLAISAVRNENIWQYLLTQGESQQGAQETYLVHNPQNEIVGYFRVAKFGFGSGLIVDEASLLPQPAAMSAIHWLKQMASERDKPYLRLSMTDMCPLIAVAKGWGAQSEGRYAWQIKFPNITQLFRKIGPVLNERIAASPFTELDRSVIINLYKRAYELKFEHGQLVDVQDIGFHDGSSTLSIPPNQLVPLVLGYKSRAELAEFYPDLSCFGQNQMLIDTLFPKMDAFIHLIY